MRNFYLKLGFYFVAFLINVQWLESFMLLNVKKPRVLLVSLCGFRHDYIEKFGLENLARFKFESNWAKTLRPQFPTQTYPNQWSMATGVRVEDHGIIADNFYDPDLNQAFSKFNNSHDELKWWNRSEPFWLDTVKNGLGTGNINWPGSHVKFADELNNKQLYHTIPSDNSPSFKEKVDVLIDLFVNKDFSFVLFNHAEPENAARKFGIASAQFNHTIKQLDNSFAYLISELEKFNLYNSDEFNLVLVSDHGMAEIRESVILDDFFNLTDVEIWSRSDAVFHLKPLKGTVELISRFDQIKNVSVYTREELPDSYGLKNNDRVGDIVLVADEGVQMIFMGDRKLGKSLRLKDYKYRREHFKNEAQKAGDGYRQDLDSMKGLLLARGTSFNSIAQMSEGLFFSSEIENTQVYQVICVILQTKCRNLNSSLEKMIADRKPEVTTSITTSITTTATTTATITANTSTTSEASRTRTEAEIKKMHKENSTTKTIRTEPEIKKSHTDSEIKNDSNSNFKSNFTVLILVNLFLFVYFC